METILDLEENKTIEFNYASLLSRFFAAICDGLIVFAFSYTIAFAFGFNFSFSIEAMKEFSLSQNRILYSLVTLVLHYVYNVGFETSQKQATPGKMLFGIKVVNLNCDRISISAAVIRTTIKDISTIIHLIPIFNPISKTFSFFTLINYLFPLWDKKKQAIHDKLAKTFVIEK